MREFKTKLGPDGRIVIPARCRKLLHLTSGVELVIKVEDDQMHLFTLKHSVKKAQNQVKKYVKKASLTQQLAKMRKEDADLE